jgi:hypothetical protein
VTTTPKVRCENFPDCDRLTWSKTGLCEGCRPVKPSAGNVRRQADNAVIRAEAVEAGLRLREAIEADRAARGIPKSGRSTRILRNWIGIDNE